MSQRMWTHDEVKALLCDACAKGVKDAAYECGTDKPDAERFEHYLNGQRVPCLASAFRYRAAQEMAAPATRDDLMNRMMDMLGQSGMLQAEIIKMDVIAAQNWTA